MAYPLAYSYAVKMSRVRRSLLPFLQCTIVYSSFVSIFKVYPRNEQMQIEFEKKE